MTDTKRLKLFRIDSALIVSLRTGFKYDAGNLQDIGLPAGAIILEKEYRPECRGWVVLVEHKSFPTVHPGSQVPYAE